MSNPTGPSRPSLRQNSRPYLVSKRGSQIQGGIAALLGSGLLWFALHRVSNHN